MNKYSRFIAILAVFTASISHAAPNYDSLNSLGMDLTQLNHWVNSARAVQEHGALINPLEFFPHQTGSWWEYKGSSIEGPVSLVSENSYINRISVSKVLFLKNSQVAVFDDSNAFGDGPVTSSVEFAPDKIVIQGSKSLNEDPLDHAILPYPLLRFPIQTGQSYVMFDKKGLQFKQDVDRDNSFEIASARAWVVSIAMEDVRVPAGYFRAALKIERRQEIAIQPSSGGRVLMNATTYTQWLVRGIGVVRQDVVVINNAKGSVKGASAITVEELSAYHIPGKIAK